jgi:hypothetical protein
MTKEIHYWENDKGSIAYMVTRDWAIEPYAIVRDGMGVLFASADRDEAIAYGNALADAVCKAMVA